MYEHIIMINLKNRDKILQVGLKVVHEHGFGAASVRDIAKAAGVPIGSFSNNFKSKEEFGLEIIDIYYHDIQKLIKDTLRNDSLSPLKRLESYIDANIKYHKAEQMKNGCLLGNFSAELGEHSNEVREKITLIFEEIQLSIIYCLKAAVKTGELSKNFKTNEMGRFIYTSLQGATLIAKAERDVEPLIRFKKIILSILKSK